MLCQWFSVPRSVSYYQPQSGRPGARPSQVTMKLDGSRVDNQLVVNSIRQLLDIEFNALGYEYITHELKKEYLINKKKVYRLMQEHNLLLGKVIRPTGKREFVKFRRIVATKPLEYLCWDIKYVWVQGERRNYYLLSVIDVYSRKILDWLFQSSIRQIDLINLFRRINQSHELKGVILRNDNGSQFIAHSVRNFLKSSEIKQEFTHVATPEENSYIEAFHSILEHDVIEPNVFGSYYEAKEMLGRYFSHYNNYRLHRSIGFITPQQKWEEAQVTYDTTFSENLFS
ncbi:IS3 family transposase [Spirosoma sp. KUDC1026]|uniref:IS3 family transposase n=1 Tax=Spirosoma sp. KUDC1026 TaxID=2745947 RepID=UPI002104704C|nr:IS3 family transposase [Spirosoma sp. KUDC1026]